MNDLPDHPVRKQPEFVMLRQLNRDVPALAWGVKLHLVRAPHNSLNKPNFVRWRYGPTPQAALDAALAHLVANALEK